MKKRFIILLLVMALSGKSVLAGGSESHGGDTRYESLSEAWFSNPNRTVRYCFSTSENFGVTPLRLGEALRSTVNMWVNYVISKFPSRSEWGEMPLNISTRFEEMEKCDGTQEVTFYFGLENDDTRREKAKFFDPVSFAAITQRDRAVGWGRGMIWLTNPKPIRFETHGVITKPVLLNWNQNQILEVILLHEWGHLFGVGHVDGTVMAADIVKRALAPFWCPRVCGKMPSPVRIDDARELFPCVRCTLEGHSQEWIGDLGDSIPSIVENFRMLTGRDPRGKVSSKILVERKPLRVVAHSIQLTVSDEVGTSKVFNLLQHTNPPPSLWERDPVFRVIVEKSGRRSLTQRYMSAAEWVGTLSTHTSRTIQFLYNQEETTPVSIRLITGYGRPSRLLFRAESTYNNCLFREVEQIAPAPFGIPLLRDPKPVPSLPICGEP